jgi:hypothetical protein
MAFAVSNARQNVQIQSIAKLKEGEKEGKRKGMQVSRQIPSANVP